MGEESRKEVVSLSGVELSGTSFSFLLFFFFLLLGKTEGGKHLKKKKFPLLANNKKKKPFNFCGLKIYDPFSTPYIEPR